MGNDVFYTIKIDGKFMNSNFMRDNTEHILEGIRFYNKEEAKTYTESIREDKGCEIIKVNCSYEIVK